jgi:hypothetical protein
MAEGATKQYIEEILEVTGRIRRGKEMLDDFDRMPENEFENLREDLRGRVRIHYKKNAGHIIELLRRYEAQPKAFYFGAGSPLDHDVKGARPDWFLRKAALYYGKIVIADPLEATLESIPLKTETLKIDLALQLSTLRVLWFWVKAGLVEVLPGVLRWDKALSETASRLADEDMKDQEWNSPSGALRTLEAIFPLDEDIGLEGKDLMPFFEAAIQLTTPQKLIDKAGGLRNLALRALLEGSSKSMSSAFFGSALTDCAPATDLRRAWGHFGLWTSKRAELLVQRGELKQESWKKMREEAKLGMAWQRLEVKQLGALMSLSPEHIIKVRDDSKLSLKSFREELGEKVKQIEMVKLADEEEIGPIVSQVSEDLNREARNVEKDLKNIRLKLGVSAAPTPLSMALGLVPFSLAGLAISLGASLTAYGLDLKRQKERSGYFLVKLEEEAKEQEVRRRRRDI